MSAEYFRAGTEILGAPAAGPTLEIALYSCLTDTVAQPRSVAWEDLAGELVEHEERGSKDGPLWSPVALLPRKTTRSNDSVEAVTLGVFDFDHCEPQWGLLDGLEYVAYTTSSHHTDGPDCGHRDCPHWRVVVLLSCPVAKADWASFWERATFWLAPDADPSCKDPSRAYWPPTCKPGAARDTRRGHGVALGPDSLGPAPGQPKAALFEPASGSGTDGERPGDRFARETKWADILTDWTHTATVDESDRWRCPKSGKRVGHCATTGGGGYDLLFVFCDAEGTPFESRTSYTKFWAYTLLEHGGDAAAATRALAKRYGMGERRNGSHANGTIPPTDSGAAAGGPAEWRFNKTDTGMAEWLIARHGADLRYCHPWGVWLVSDGARFRRDQVAEARYRAKESIRALYAIAAGIEDDAERKALVKLAREYESAARVAAMLRQAGAERGVPILPEEMDADQLLFNVRNGTIDLRTGRLRAHRREDLLTELAPVEYDPTAECPTFMAFLERILPDEAVRTFLQRAVGYALTGDTSEQCLFFLHGGGANGKSMLLTVLQAILGDYAKQAAPEMLTARGGDRHPTELADLFGARLVTSVEVSEGKRLAETLVKQMTGGDRMKARFMRTDFFEWTPTHKLFLAANHKPVIRGTDYAIWRRIHLVPFGVTIPKDERDRKLPAKLLAEAPGILAWAVRGCVEWQRDGLGVPKAVEDATAAYRAEQDVLAEFLVECCLVGKAEWAASSDLYKAYVDWCDKSGERPPAKNPFGTRLSERGFTAEQRGKQKTRGSAGLRLLTDLERAQRTQAGADSGIAGSPPLSGGSSGNQRPLRPPRPPGTARETECWSCHADLSADAPPTCPACGWLVCPACGQCEEGGGCAGEVTEEGLPW